MNKLNVSITTPYGFIGEIIPHDRLWEKIKLRSTSYEAIEQNLPNIEVAVKEEPANVVQFPDVAVSEKTDENVVSEVATNVVQTVADQPVMNEIKEEMKVEQMPNILFSKNLMDADVVSAKALKLKEEKLNMMRSKIVQFVPATEMEVVENKVEEAPVAEKHPVVEETKQDVPEVSDSTGLYGTMMLDGILSIDAYQPVEQQVESETPVATEVKEENVVEQPVQEATVVPPTMEVAQPEVPVEPTVDAVVAEVTNPEVAPIAPETPVVEQVAEVNEPAQDEPTEDITEEYKDVSRVYQFCEEVDAQRAKTEEATREVNRLSQEFAEYKIKSQQDIEESNRKRQEASEGLMEAEERNQTAKRFHQESLRNLITTGKRQQELLREREKEAKAQFQQVKAEMDLLEKENTMLLNQNEEKTNEDISKARELDEETQMVNDEAAKWDAIAHAMEDPEESLTSVINTDNIYSFSEEDQTQYVKAA